MEQLKILVVDDEPDVESLFLQKFRKEIKDGLYNVHFVRNAMDALDYIKQHGPAQLTMVLSDINMPKMDGLELLKIIKDEHRDMKVIMITAYGDEENFQRAKSLGADLFLNKPVNFSLLQKKIHELSL